MKRLIKDGNSIECKVSLDWQKILINACSLALGLYGLVFVDFLSTALSCSIISFVAMYLGIVTYHRLLIHQSFSCPKPLEYILAYLSTFSGMPSPIDLVHNHDLRDWAQRKPHCHSFFCHRNNVFIDGFQQLFCKITLKEAPQFKVELEEESFYRNLKKYWYINQALQGYLLFLIASWPGVLGGLFLKIWTTQFGHWLMAWCLHNFGEQKHLVKGAGVQGFNIPLFALITMGESYHNNHHLCPNAAKNSFFKGQFDLAWGFIFLLKQLGLAKNIILFQAKTQIKNNSIKNHINKVRKTRP